MATVITGECISCGACEPECPNAAVYQGGVQWQAGDGAMHPPLSDAVFFIVPEKCTECVGFHEREACAAVCPVDCCVPDPDRVETHETLLERARVLHPGKAIADDAPSRFRKKEAEAGEKPAAPKSAPAALPPSPPPPAVAATPPAGDGKAGLAIPPIDEWEIPVRCFRCRGDHTVPFRHYRAGVVFFCPHCGGSFVPTLAMACGVGEALSRFHEGWTAAFEEFHEKRHLELAVFEEGRRSELERFLGELRRIATRGKAPGAPAPRRGFFTF